MTQEIQSVTRRHCPAKGLQPSNEKKHLCNYVSIIFVFLFCFAFSKGYLSPRAAVAARKQKSPINYLEHSIYFVFLVKEVLFFH